MNIHKMGPRKSGILWRAFSFGMKLATLLIGQEVVRRKLAEAKARALAKREAQRHMNEFLSIISHELKTPLTSIKGNIQLMTRRIKHVIGPTSSASDDTSQLLIEAGDLLDRTDQQITRLTRLVNSLLESSRIHANTMELLFEVCELDTLVREVVEDSRYISPQRTVILDIPADTTVLILADANRVKQVVIHYLSNAHKFSSLDSPIAVHLHEDGPSAHFSIRDEGPGIRYSEQKRIWERFYRVPDIDVLNGSEVGLGLGLHISRTIIEQHRGRVGVTSAPGQGSTFWFSVPLLSKSLGAI